MKLWAGRHYISLLTIQIPWGRDWLNILAPVFSNEAVDRLRQLSEPKLSQKTTLRLDENSRSKKSVTFLRTDWDSDPVNFNDKDHPSVDQVEYFERDWSEIHAVKNNLIGIYFILVLAYAGQSLRNMHFLASVFFCSFPVRNILFLFFVKIVNYDVRFFFI